MPGDETRRDGGGLLPVHSRGKRDPTARGATPKVGYLSLVTKRGSEDRHSHERRYLWAAGSLRRRPIQPKRSKTPYVRRARRREGTERSRSWVQFGLPHRDRLSAFPATLA